MTDQPMSEHTPWCCDGYAAFCPLCPRPTDLVQCPGHAYTDHSREAVRVSRLHAQHAHPDFEYRITNGPRKQWDTMDAPPTDEDGIPEQGWERNVDRGSNGWERFDYHEEAYWRRPKRKAGDPCERPECGGEQHTDPWGTPVQCPHAEPVVQADTGRRCPRCDCPDGHEQCQHCKVCPHARSEPTPLTREQLEPIVAAVHRREGYARAGVGFLLPPFPACPTCGQSPTEMAVRQSERFIEDRVQFGFRPCGHTFTVDGEDLYAVYEAVRQRVAQEETS